MTTTIRLAATALLLSAGMAQAQSVQCTDHEAMQRMLAENWGESRQSIALDAADSMVELFASAETGTWTLTVTQPGGPTCMIASGHAFEMVRDPLPVLDEGA
ncbi:hypothetical protein Rumeso_01887 [Rubellimicrobium mesophilum DSM 19309]|uniref:Uncharacterized protein n=1 Tax=Rubellimicrobium mesophilum DSM 19309 TaxID=442562 RepID=A0A017HQ20_9RHOB|nr:hypothetical protein [Rubellimicrobium mesophilum]EYD76466.1 hypothetical protein Rumeso_01887 [Rubellimicrobium mesophilum DSM 19309]